MKQLLKVFVGLVVLGISTLSSAAIPASAATAVTGILTDMQSWFDLVFPAIILGVTLTMGPKLLKRFTTKI